jgi:transposase
MLSVPGQVKIFLCLEPADMRRSFDGLAAMVEHVMQQHPLSGNLFVFRNKRADRVKLLYWEDGGLAIWYKRLEEGCFRFPRAEEGQTSVTISATDLAMLLDGVDLQSVRRRKRYRRSA